ncbi:serine/threonine-protein kinase [Rhodococcoides kroppenstedtii]|uniref:serine/threonine-protein kinase n=1 Tax=Rhodococcoides kroppenstedtii TaxID=293050 RepID=UPI0011141107|nr:serine/threonine-protein kinase [Rhodococcus kroppenstedtii]
MTRTAKNVMVEKSELGELTSIGSGGQAKVYSAADYTMPGMNGRIVYKQYRKAILAKYGDALYHGMPELILFPDSLDDKNQKYLSTLAVWPKALVVENGRALGILMRIIPDTFFFDMILPNKNSRTLLELQHFYRMDAQKQELGIPLTSDKDKILLVLKLIKGIEFFHRHNLVLGDFSPRNVVVSHPAKLDGPNKGKLFPKFLDIDSFRFRGGQPPIEQMNTPMWYPPEIRKAQDQVAQLTAAGATSLEVGTAEAHMRNLNFRTDVFKFGLATLRLFHSSEDAIAIYISPDARIRIAKLIGTKRANVLLASLEENPVNRPTMADILKQFQA